MTRKEIIRIGKRLILIFGLPAVLLYACTAVYVMQHMRGDGDQFTAADCGIVFGTAVWPVRNQQGNIVDYVAGPGIQRRVSAAAALFAQGRVHRLFFTGGRAEEGTASEAEVMRDYAVSLGVTPERITLEDDATSTWENLVYTRNLTSDCRSVVAVSDGYHLPRIKMYAEVMDWDLQTYPAENPAQMTFTIRSLLREAAAIDLLVVVRLLT